MLASHELAILGAILFISSTFATHDIFLPELLGKHPVGTTSFELNNAATQRDLMIYAHYPTTDDHYPLARDWDSTFATWLDNYANFTDSGRIVTRAHNNAPLCSTDFPILIFGPGYGEPVRFSGRQTMSNLASQGYIVFGMDHPNDTQIIEYPNGTVVYHEEDDNINPPDYAELIPYVNNRISDTNFLASQLKNASVVSAIPGLHYGLEFESLGILGFSLGGASAASTMLTNPIFACGANMDGAFIGNITELGLDKPFLMMNSMTHQWPSDYTWPTFYSNLRGFKKDIQINGTRHKSYGDWLILKNLLVPDDTDPANADLIPGTRMLEITSAYLTSYFDWCLKNGTGELLFDDDPKGAGFPEVTFITENSTFSR
jgi:hypothetical protein